MGPPDLSLFVHLGAGPTVKRAAAAILILVAGAILWVLVQNRPEHDSVEVGFHVSDSTCAYTVPDSIVLTAEERCLLEVHKNRCSEDDRCIVGCLASGQGRGIGGGCWHMCFAYRETPWSEPPGMAACQRDSLAAPSSSEGESP